ncbi:MAG TPA: fibronectin type III domain-containing protein, partial [Kiritimatiellia bacterium]
MQCRINVIASAVVCALLVSCATAPKGDPNVLNVPQGLTASQDGLREATVSWAAPTDGSVKYVIERGEAADGPFDAIGEALLDKHSYTDAGKSSSPLADSTTYYYRLIAVSAQGARSDPSEAVTSTTAPPPAQPGSVAADAPESRGVRVSWQASTSEGVVKYRVERTEAAEPENFITLVEVTTTEYIDGGTAASTLKDSTLYLYRILAINRVGSVGAPTEPVQVTTMPPPEPPKDLAASERQVRCVPLAWEVSREEDVIRYDVYRAISAK